MKVRAIETDMKLGISSNTLLLINTNSFIPIPAYIALANPNKNIILKANPNQLNLF